MLFYNYFGNFSYLVTYQRNIFFFVVSISLIIIFTCISSLPLASAQSIPSISPSIGVGSKFQVVLEKEFMIEGGVQSRDVIVGEVQLYPGLSSIDKYFEIKGSGRGSHEATISLCKAHAQGNYNATITGSMVDQGNGYTFISIDGIPTSPEHEEFVFDWIGGCESQGGPPPEEQQRKISEMYIATNPHAGGTANVTYTSLSGGVNVEENVGPYGLFKMSLSPPALKYAIQGTVKDEKGNAMSNSKVVIVDLEELKKKLGKKYSPSIPLKLSDLQLPFEQKTATSDDKNSKYSFTIDGRGRIYPTILVVSLLWYDKEKGGGGEFAITTGPEKGGKKIPIYMISCVSNLERACQPWKTNKAKDGFEAELNFVYGDVVHPDMDKEDVYPRSPSKTVIQYDAANVYYNSYRAIKYFESLKGKVGMKLNPVTIDIYDSMDSLCFDQKKNKDKDNAFYDSEKVLNIGGLGKYLDPVNSIGGTVSICKETSRNNQYDAPLNREYHELGHYLQYDMYYPKSPVLPDRGKPHAGYENSGTNDSVVEGFASFVALLIAEHYQGGSSSKYMPLYPGGPGSIDLDVDYQVWGDHVRVTKDSSGNFKFTDRPNHGPPDDEEDAIDGILWDLHDNTRDSHSGLSEVYPTSVDEVPSIPASTILGVISNTKPMNLLQLYNAFEAELPKQSVDMIFVNHGAFGDAIKRNLKQDLGELTGYTGDPRTNPDRTHRTKVPTQPGSYIVSQNDATFNISMIHDSPNNNYDNSYLINMTKGELTYFRMSPSYYPSKAVFDQVTRNGTLTLVKNAITIDSDEYWDYISSNPKDNQTFKTIPSVVDTTQQKTYDIHEDPRFNGNNTLTNDTSYDMGNNISSSNQNNSSSLSALSNASTPIVQSNNSVVNNQYIPQEITTNTTSILSSPQKPMSNISGPSYNETSNVTTLSTASNETYVDIKLLPASEPLFFKCNVTTENASPTLPGLNVSESLAQVLTDNKSDTHLAGNATFDIIFEMPLADMPGPDLIINESGSDSESYSVGVLTGNNSTQGTLNVVASPIGTIDSCGNQINSYQLDFSSLPHQGNAIYGIRIDNDPDKNGGADISDIITVNLGKLFTHSTDKVPAPFNENSTVNN
jgi:hypothetical protein